MSVCPAVFDLTPVQTPAPVTVIQPPHCNGGHTAAIMSSTTTTDDVGAAGNSGIIRSFRVVTAIDNITTLCLKKFPPLNSL